MASVFGAGSARLMLGGEGMQMKQGSEEDKEHQRRQGGTKSHSAGPRLPTGTWGAPPRVGGVG